MFSCLNFPKTRRRFLFIKYPLIKYMPVLKGISTTNEKMFQIKRLIVLTKASGFCDGQENNLCNLINLTHLRNFYVTFYYVGVSSVQIYEFYCAWRFAKKKWQPILGPKSTRVCCCYSEHFLLGIAKNLETHIFEPFNLASIHLPR